MSTPQSIIDAISKPFFDSKNVLATKLPSGGVQLANLSSGMFHYVGELEYELLLLCDGKRTVKEIAQVGPVRDENRMCKFITTAFSLGIMGEPERRRRDVLLLTFRLFNPSRIFKPESRLSVYLRNFLYVSAIISLLFSLTIIAYYFSDLATSFWTTFFLNPVNWLYYLLDVAIIGFFHEFSHAVILTSYGLPSVEMGFAIAVFQPAFYADVSGVRRIPKKACRIMVWAAGILPQIIIMAITLGLLAFVELQEPLANFLMMFLLVNILLMFFTLMFSFRYDGYYIMSEILGVTELREESMAYVAGSTDESYLQLTAMRKFVYTVVGVFSRSFPAIVVTMLVSNIVPLIFGFTNIIIEVAFPAAIFGLPVFLLSRRYAAHRRLRT